MTPEPTDIVRLPQKGDTIAGKYQVEDTLGQGGMGVVVAARHLALRQRVAVKFLLPAGLRLPGARERFLREAQAAAALQSEHVARVLDVGLLESGAPFLVMEHLSGTDLSRLLKSRRQLPISEAVDLILQACEAIGEAHARGIVHRDLKPSNLFIVTRGSAPFIKVLDFGLSKMTADASEAPEASLTASDMVIGSPHYMSPEQIRSLKHVDARTDVWALGVILYQLIAGRRPFDGDQLCAIYASTLFDTPIPLPLIQPETPAPLDALVQRCLAKDPARRIQSVADLMQGLFPFSPPRAPFSSEPLVPTPSRVPTAPPPPTLVPAGVALVPDASATREGGSSIHEALTHVEASFRSGAPTHEGTSAQLAAREQTQPPWRKIARVAVAGAVPIIGIFAMGVMLQIWGSGRDDATQATTAVNAVLPMVNTEKEETSVSSQQSITIAPLAPRAPSTSAPGLAPVSSASSRPRPEARVFSAVSAKVKPPPMPVNQAPAATANPDCDETTRPQVVKDTMEPWK